MLRVRLLYLRAKRDVTSGFTRVPTRLTPISEIDEIYPIRRVTVDDETHRFQGVRIEPIFRAVLRPKLLVGWKFPAGPGERHLNGRGGPSPLREGQ